MSKARDIADLDFNSPDIDGGNIDGATIGGTTPAAGSFSQVNVDNITIDGNEIDVGSGVFTLDVASDIRLDAGGGNIQLLKGGTEFGRFFESGTNDFYVYNPNSDKDIIIYGNDAGTSFEAARFDMSAAGAATFNSNITSGGHLALSQTGDFATTGLTYHTNGWLYARGGDNGIILKNRASTVEMMRIKPTEVVINDDAIADLDFRVESDSNTRMLFVDGGNDRVGIGGAPSARMEIISDGSDAAGAELRLTHANNNTNDVIATLNFGNNTGSAARIRASTTGANNTGLIQFFADNAGTDSQVASFQAEKIVFNETGNNQDFRVESDNNANMLFVDGGDNFVGVGTGSGVVDSSNTSYNMVFPNHGGIAIGSAYTFANIMASDGNIYLKANAYPANTGSTSKIYLSTANASGGLSDPVIVDDGNLLVGTSNVAPAVSNSEVGVALSGSLGYVAASRSAGASGFFNRLSDGDIVTFNKNGVTVGHIGAFGGDLYIGTNDSGLRFEYAGLNTIVPFDVNSSAISDAATDLGHENARFKDLHLSGGVQFGTAGAAAELLDDYEEGTWIPVTKSGSTTITTSVNYAKYVKIGALVYVTAFVSRNDGATLTSDIKIEGLPFQVASGSAQVSGSIWFDTTGTDEVATNYFVGGASFLQAKKVGASGSYVTADKLQNGRPYYMSGVYNVAI